MYFVALCHTISQLSAPKLSFWYKSYFIIYAIIPGVCSSIYFYLIKCEETLFTICSVCAAIFKQPNVSDLS